MLTSAPHSSPHEAAQAEPPPTISVPWAAGRLAVVPVPKVKPGHLITGDLYVWRKPSCGPGFRTLHHGPL